MNLQNVKQYFSSTIGTKQVVAITGLAMLLFLVAHMVGVLQIYLGQDAINEYGVFLRSLGHGAVIWLFRIGLLAVFIVHIIFTIKLSKLNNDARPQRYAVAPTIRKKASALSTRAMIYTGLLITAFVLLHIGHFTLGVVEPAHFDVHDAHGRHDVFTMMIRSFSSPGMVVVYVISLIAICSHLSHGASSWIQTLGIATPESGTFISRLGTIIAVILLIGFSAIPLGILFSLVSAGSTGGGH